MTLTLSDEDGPSTLDDRPLLDRARIGDREAFGELYDRHVRAVYWQALGVVGDPILAEDVTQDAFVTLWHKARAVHVVDSSVLPWLLVTAKYHGLNAGRRVQRERRRTDAIDDDLPAPGGVDDDLEQTEVKAEIDRAVASLSGPDRRVYELCIDGDHTYESAARELGVSHASVRNRLSRVRSKLRADLRALREAS